MTQATNEEGKNPHETPKWHIHQPMGFSWFPKEIAPVPRSWIETTGNPIFFRRQQKVRQLFSTSYSALHDHTY